ncbi:MAG: dicarboxylate/amino acid:cation symporter [Pirellulales bacterium]
MTRLALHWEILIAMLLGAVIGVALNLTAGQRTTARPVSVRERTVEIIDTAGPVQLDRGNVWIRDGQDQILLQINTRRGEGVYESRRVIVRPPSVDAVAQWPEPPPQVDADEPVPVIQVPALRTLKQQDPQAYALFHLYGRSLARRVGDMAGILGDLFLRMLQMVSVPLIITSLITGVTGLGRAERLGRMFGRTLSYYLITSMLAIFVGLTFVNLIRPGANIAPALQAAPPAAEVEQIGPDPGEELTGPQSAGKGLGAILFEQLRNMIPPNPIQAVAEGNFLSIIAFSLAFGIFTILVGGRTAEIIATFFEAAFEVIMKMTMAIILLAPLGVLFLMLSVTATEGVGIFGTLGWYMVTVACALALHAMVVLPLILKFVARRDPLEFARAMSPALLTAFSSASSNGTLPLTLTSVEQRAGISNRVGSFVLPLGATINMDGTALYEVVAVLFIAQFNGIELDLAQQIIVALTALLASIGAAGIPHAGLIMMIIILQAVNLPTETQGLIIAVDRVLDMCRTSVNVWSDSVGCAVVARFEADGGAQAVPAPAVAAEAGEFHP